MVKLEYNKSARTWNEALPLGNGRMGAMIFGGVEEERLQINEDSLWSGSPKDWNNPESKKLLPEIRRLIAEGQYQEADQLTKNMMGPYGQSYLPMGNLNLLFDHGNQALEYERSLDISTGVSNVKYQIGQVIYTRESFISFPDQLLIVHLSASSPEMLTFTATMDSPLQHRATASTDDYIIHGICPEHVDPNYYKTDEPVRYGDPDNTDALRFSAYLSVLDHDAPSNGNIRTNVDGIHVSKATSVTLLFSVATSYNGFERQSGKEGKDPTQLADYYLKAGLQKSYSQLLQNHIEDHRSLFDRVHLNLGSMGVETDDTTKTKLYTDQRIKQNGVKENSLVELLFQYGRYLMIASSRPGTQPANLQGIWNQNVQAPWSSNWTININTQMNYWPAEVSNLEECHDPLFNFLEELAQNGEKTASVNYGCRGWLAHHNVDLWRQSAPVGGYGHGDPVWAFWQMGGAWLCQHLWEHYSFNHDVEFLRNKAYPLMKGAALFCLDWLIEDEEGQLITSPSTSPEHPFIFKDGQTAAVSQATTMDISIIWDLFTNCIKACEILKSDDEFKNQLSSALEKLPPLRIGSKGQLQEWSQDWKDEDPHHRHLSHLFGVFPGKQITIKDTPELYRAAKKSLDIRGDEGTGWSLAWKVNLWARMHDGDRALHLISQLLQLVEEDEISTEKGGVYANLFDAHPPFQIDGNFGFTAGLCEMLVQSHTDCIHFLPALPKLWPEGNVSGLRTRGGYEVGLEWQSGMLKQATIHATLDSPCRLQISAPVTIETQNHSVDFKWENDNMLVFNTEKGKTYRVTKV